MPKSSVSAAETLQEAKNELMARLQDSAPIRETNGDVSYDDEIQERFIEDDQRSMDAVADSINEDEEDDDEEYQSPDDQERGLLTDVPLVLGPTEIEALPMIIQAGIVDNFGLKGGERQGTKNMQAVRCHILLAQEAGRNVLRELLIFIAAWDLPDDEFYFKMMVQIMEAILKNGLMSHAYSDFGQAKDIISPAQAVVIKILTHIFRTRYSPSSIMNGQTAPKEPSPLTRVDVLTVRYIFTVFRGNIIPETCALVYLQGQIKQGHALAEDFPLNLWDMERVYEGVYQFLEFFAVLTESNDWKALLIEWEIVYDLVTLITELDQSVPKASLKSQMPPAVPPLPNGYAKPAKDKMPQPQKADVGLPSAESITNPSAAKPVSVERPFDALPANPQPSSSSSSQSATSTTATTMPPPPLPLPLSPLPQTDPSLPPRIPPPTGPLPSGSHQPSTPSLFEWRNLKKLIVLVLSSLVWKSRVVQDQIRAYGGVDTILSCTAYDAHNPYIREHAVMCLKFLLEGNEANMELVRGLEARGTVKGGDVGGEEVLQGMGVEVEVREGRVRLRERERERENVGANMNAKGSGSTGLMERFGKMEKDKRRNSGQYQQLREKQRRASEGATRESFRKMAISENDAGLALPRQADVGRVVEELDDDDDDNDVEFM